MDFLAIAMDHSDQGAPDRPMAARDEHLADIKKLNEERRVVAGGAILGNDGRTIGDTVIFGFPDRESVG